MKSKSLALAAFTFALAPLQADFSYQETTKITGGSLTKMMRFVPGGGKSMEPRTSYVYLKGDRLAHVFPDSISIIDLGNETMTEVNMEKKTYATITFAEMREAMQKMAVRMEEAMAKQKNSGQPAPQMDFQVNIKRTGQTRTISGLDTREYIMTLAMTAQSQPGGPVAGISDIENDMWMTAKVPGYDQVQAFYMRMGQKIGFTPGMNPLLTQQRGSGEAMKRLADEMAKLEGTPVMTITRIKGVTAMGALMGSPSQQSSNGGGSVDSNDRPRLGGGLTGMAASGIMGGFRKKKQQQEQQEQKEAAPSGSTSSAGDNVMMETQSESSNFSNAAVDAAKLEIPAGFQKVEHPMRKALDRK